MIRLLALLAAFAAVAPGAGPERRVTRTDLVALEKSIDGALSRMFPEEPWLLLGYSRGVYVEGVGVVFSADVNLAVGPSVSPFNPQPAQAAVAAHREKKKTRLPVLRDTMYGILKNLASQAGKIPPEEQVVLAVTLMRYPYEAAAETPTQIVMHVPRAKLLDAVSRNVPLNGAVKLEEY